MADTTARCQIDGPQLRAVGARTGALFTVHGRMVFAVCRAILHDPDEAEDATQATFLSAHEALLSGTTVRNPGAWLAMIARNECRTRLRGRGSEPLPLREECIISALTMSDDVERRSTVEQLRAAIASLPEKQRAAVVLRDLYGLRYSEIGSALGVSRPSVEALLFRARRTLRIRLRPVAGGALAVPLAVREGLAQAIPWFVTTQAGTAGVTGAGIGVITKLAWPVAAKVVVAVAAIGVAGTAATTPWSPAVVEREISARPMTHRQAAPTTSATQAADAHRLTPPAASPVAEDPPARQASSEAAPAAAPRQRPLPQRVAVGDVRHREGEAQESGSGTRETREAGGTSPSRPLMETRRAPLPAPTRTARTVVERDPTDATTPGRAALDEAPTNDSESPATSATVPAEASEPGPTRNDELHRERAVARS